MGITDATNSYTNFVTPPVLRPSTKYGMVNQLEEE